MAPFHLLLPLIVLQTVSAEYHGHRYTSNNHSMQLQLSLKTGTEHGAGTDSDIIFGFGFSDPKSGELLWHYEGHTVDGSSPNRFESGRWDTLNYDKLNTFKFFGIEKTCAAKMNTEEEYKRCLSNPNTLFIDLYRGSWWNAQSMAWQLERAEVRTKISHAEHGKDVLDHEGSLKFKATPGGFWIENKYYYLRSNEGIGEPFCDVGHGKPKLGQEYECNLRFVQG
ncbi:hypothetical protein L596_025523 [Steinernema carpocapsae]|uniref:Uncharacterized protein n=1 Tax=Steinernema carpocapsae TaxID=34508 RepID=A0A4U5M872_STECR|nr:hypothetical protein L596_025523 [Steinernema carpocapsae]